MGAARTLACGLALAGLLFTTGCDQGTASGSASGCVSAPPLERDVDLPPELPLTDGLNFTRARVDRQSVVVEAVDRTSVEDLFERLRGSITAHGYETVAVDFEGFEAEIFFSDKSVSAGALRLREGPCRGQVTVTLLFDPIDTDAGERILDRARARLS